MSKEVIIVLDCGATNVRAIAVDTEGKIVAKGVVNNATQTDPENASWLIWSVEEILDRFAQCVHQVQTRLGSEGYRILGITITTFGVDGALVDDEGELLYPVISWKCPRTAAFMEDIRRYFDPGYLQRISGVGHFSFNTLYKLIWFKESRPELLARAKSWLFISSLLVHRLTGVMSTDRTMAGTSQFFDLNNDRLSSDILEAVGIKESLFPRMVSPGETVGSLLPGMAAFLGLPAGIPVMSAGHDTQFALFGSGAGLNQPVLSSGTWEILMVRTSKVDTAALSRFARSTCELDSSPGLFNPGLQWLASAVLEWVREICWGDSTVDDLYSEMIRMASAVPPGCEGVTMLPDLLIGASGAGNGVFSGLSIKTTRAHLYRAALEALALCLRNQLAELEQICGFATEELLLVGGGAKNALWNQIKADTLCRTVRVVAENEITVLGAAMYALYGLGMYDSPEDAHKVLHHDYQIFRPQ